MEGGMGLFLYVGPKSVQRVRLWVRAHNALTGWMSWAFGPCLGGKGPVAGLAMGTPLWGVRSNVLYETSLADRRGHWRGLFVCYYELDEVWVLKKCWEGAFYFILLWKITLFCSPTPEHWCSSQQRSTAARDSVCDSSYSKAIVPKWGSGCNWIAQQICESEKVRSMISDGEAWGDVAQGFPPDKCLVFL